MKLFSLIKKSYRLIEKMKLNKNRVYNNFYIVGEKPQGGKVVLYLKNPEFMHFGDHFFFEPLIRFLIKSGYDASIMPTNGMEFYFKKCGYRVSNEEELKTADFIITRFELLDEVKNYNSVIAIDTASLKIKEFLCKDLVDKTAKILNKEIVGFDYKPMSINAVSTGIELDSDKKYIIFNNYIDSGAYRVTKAIKDSLLRFAEKYAEEHNYIVIHTGTQKEKEKDKNRYNSKWLDLRGKTKPEDLFWLSGQAGIEANISFDAFGMHLFFIYGKKNFIKFRGRFTKKGTEFIMKYVNPPFPYKKELKEIIEYI